MTLLKFAIALGILIFGWNPPAAFGDEPCEQFLQALRDAGYHDVALDYLSEMENSPLASSSFKAILPFEKAQTLISSTARIRDVEKLEECLNEAERLLAQSESNANTPELTAKSQQAQGDLLFRRASYYLNLAENERLTVDEKTAYLNQARSFLKNALEVTSKARESWRKLLENFQVDLRDPESKQQLKQLRATYVMVLSRLPQILESSAETLATDDPEREKSLELAAADYEQVWVKHPTYPAAHDSCLYAARCQYKLKKYALAISLIQQILGLPDSSSFATLKQRAMVLAADCWSKIEPYPFDDVIANVEPVTARLTRGDQRAADWQRVQLELARAYHAKAEDLKTSGGDAGRIKNFDQDAARLMKSIARLPGEHRTLATRLLSEWNLTVESVPEIVLAPIKTFADAKQQGTDLMAEIEVIHADVNDLRRQQAAAGADNGDALQDELAQAEQRLETTANRSLDIFQRGLILADSKTSREDINQIRFLQSVCYYTKQNYVESALIGEFLIDRYPNVAFSRQAGGLAVRSCAWLHDQAGSDDKAYERERITSLAEKIVDRWPGSDESAAAAAKMADLVLDTRKITDADIELAKKYISSVTESSIEKAMLNAKLGTKLWFVYRNRRQEKTENAEQLAAHLAGSVEYLTEGMKGLDRDHLNMEVAWAALFLVDALLQSGDLDAAITQLETSAMAPIDLVQQKNPVILQSANSDLFISETWKTAGNVYLAALNRNPSDGQWIDKAIGIVNAMQSRADQNPDPQARQDVVNMYLLIAAQMRRQFDAVEDPQKKTEFAAGLTRFLDRIRTESNDPNTMIWAGKTLMELADSFASQSMDAEAKPMFDMAIETLERASKMGIEDQGLVNELKRQQAIAKRGLGEFEESYGELVELLRLSPNAWNMQMDAARTLQVWGVQKRKPEQLAKALAGAEKFRDPKTRRQSNLVWGWARLADVLKNNPKFSDPYYRSLYAAVETRLEYGLIEQKQEVIAAALKQIELTKARDETLGGPDWISKFEKLEQRVRNSMSTLPVTAAAK